MKKLIELDIIKVSIDQLLKGIMRILVRRIMVDYLVLSTEITIYEALEIKEKLALEVRNKAEAYTKEFKAQGITKLGIWIDHDSILYEPTVKNCTLNVTVNARQFCQDGMLDANKVLTTLDEVFTSIELRDIIWKLQNISFAYTLYGPYAKEYVGLLNCGKSMSSLGIKKEVDNKRSPKMLTYSSKGMTLKFAYNEDEDCLAISLWLLKQKVASLADRYGIKQREFKAYAGFLKETEWYLWSDYIKRIAGEENYYSYKQAETIIDSSGRSKIEKENMKNVLKGVAVYKGVEHYLSHVSDADAVYEFMVSIHTEDTAKKYVSLLKKEGVNPVGISRRYSQENDIHVIPNLISVLKNEDVTRYRRIKHKTNNQDKLPDAVQSINYFVSELPFD